MLWVRTFPVLCTIFGHSFIVCAVAPPLALVDAEEEVRWAFVSFADILQ